MADIEMKQKNPEISSPSMSTSNRSNKFLDMIMKNLLLITTLLGVTIAIILGMSLRSQHLSKDTILLISYPGELFLRMLRLLTLPLLISSIITISSNRHAGVSSRMVFQTMMYFVLTTIMAIFIGFTIALTFKPGTKKPMLILENKKEGKMLDSLLDLGRNLFPGNLFEATFQQTHTIFIESKLVNGSTTFERQLTHRSGPNTMGLVVFCLLFGFGVNQIGERGETIKLFFSGIFEVLLSITTKVMWLSGIGVCSVITAKIVEIEDLPEIDDVPDILSQLGLFMLCVILGVFVHQLVMMPAIYFCFVQKNPYTFYLNLMDPWVTAFAVCSSVVTLPTTLHCMIEKMKADERVARFVITLGVPLNLDGTAIFLSVASIFVARLNGVDVNVSKLIVILITITAVSMAMPSVPSSSLVALLIVLSAIDVDPKDVSLLFAVDWILDRFRTTSNVLADCFAAAVIEKISQKELRMVQPPNSVANEANTDEAHFLRNV